jgi:transposase
MTKKKPGPGGREIATEYKLLVVKERMRGTSQEDVAAAFGVSVAAVQKWTTLFRKGGRRRWSLAEGGAARSGYAG